MPTKKTTAPKRKTARTKQPELAHIAADLRPLATAIATLTPDPANARKHGARNLETIAASLRQFGQVKPIVVTEGGQIIAGNGTVEAARTLGWTHVAATRFANVEQARAYALADNRTAELADWDIDLLKSQVDELAALDFDVASLGFDTSDIDRIIRDMEHRAADDREPPPEITEDEPPPPPKKAITKPGDLWLLGNHRLMCGDSTKAEDVARLMDGERAGLMNTDPPYGVAYANDDRPNPGVAKPRVAKPRVAKDELRDDALQAFLETAFGAAVSSALNLNAAWYLWHAHLTQGFFAAAAAAAAANVVLHRQIIWVKPVLLLTRGQYHWKHEPCFMGWVEGQQPPDYGAGNGERNQTTVWEIAGVQQAERKEFDHSTPKPVELFAIPIVKHLKPGEIAYEPFSGSGPQIIAAEQLGRRCFAMELEPQYVDVAVARWEKLTGQKAQRAES